MLIILFFFFFVSIFLKKTIFILSDARCFDCVDEKRKVGQGLNDDRSSADDDNDDDDDEVCVNCGIVHGRYDHDHDYDYDYDDGYDDGYEGHIYYDDYQPYYPYAPDPIEQLRMMMEQAHISRQPHPSSLLKYDLYIFCIIIIIFLKQSSTTF
jgi:hypothetical protein